MWENESEYNILIVGHRGIRSLYPENTMASFRAALELKLDLIEFDVHYTKDHHIVVCHDATIDRTTDGNGLICDMSLTQLQSFDAGIRKAPRFVGERIPTLEQVLELIVAAPYEVLVNVEIKDYDHQLVDDVIVMLKLYGLDKRSVIACFNAEIISYIQTAHPEMKTQGFPKRYMEPRTPVGFQFTEAFYDNMFGIGIPIFDDTDEKSRQEDVAFAKEHGIRPWLFCADDEERTREAVEAGATNITCNNPYPALRYLGRNGLHKPREAWLAPSMMCISEWKDSEDILGQLERNGVELLHADVMDGEFVSNIMMGTESIRHLRKASKIPLDIHLMIERPEDKLGWFDIQPGEYVSVHIESTRHLQKALARIREYGAHPMAALNPATPIYALEDVIEDIDGVLLMTVNPGFAGQRLVPQTLNKISRLREMLDKAGRPEVHIEVDGNVSFENGREMKLAGADIFVCGTSSVFSRNRTISENIVRFRSCVEEFQGDE